MAAKAAWAYGVLRRWAPARLRAAALRVRPEWRSEGERPAQGGGFGSVEGAVGVADFGLGFRGRSRSRSGPTRGRGENPYFVWVLGVFPFWFP